MLMRKKSLDDLRDKPLSDLKNYSIFEEQFFNAGLFYWSYLDLGALRVPEV